MTPDLHAKLALQIAHTTATLETLVQDVLAIRARLIHPASPERDPEPLLAELRAEFDQARQKTCTRSWRSCKQRLKPVQIPEPYRIHQPLPPNCASSSMSMKLSKLTRSSGGGGMNVISKVRWPKAISVAGFLALS